MEDTLLIFPFSYASSHLRSLAALGYNQATAKNCFVFLLMCNDLAKSLFLNYKPLTGRSYTLVTNLVSVLNSNTGLFWLVVNMKIILNTCNIITLKSRPLKYTTERNLWNMLYGIIWLHMQWMQIFVIYSCMFLKTLLGILSTTCLLYVFYE